MNKKSVHEVENILKVALAAKKEEMASMKMQQALDQAQEEISKLQAEIARLENNASMASKERLELIRIWLKLTKHYVLESLPLLKKRTRRKIK
jgi:phosphoenolpyruvate synthase/pyruvate phosphate dikinase